MRKFDRIIFVDRGGTERGPMAAYILKEQLTEAEFTDIEVLSRGIFVPFEEPLNQKIEAVLKGNNIDCSDFQAVELKEEDITDDAAVFVMEEVRRQQIISRFERAHEANVFVLSTFIGDELEIMDPYGENIQIYGMCFELLRESMKKLLILLTETDENPPED